MADQKEVALESLVGAHVLTGVEMDQDPGDANGILFVLDGITYKATEDESDGYRSSLRDLIVSDRQVSNIFQPCRVLASLSSGNDDVLEFRDMSNGQVILEVGTDNADDYYPSFVANFSPEKMAMNVGKDEP